MPKVGARSDSPDKANVARAANAGLSWAGVCKILKRELGDAAFGSWIAPAVLRDVPSGDVVVVTPTGIARDWIRRSAWRRIQELWAAQEAAAGHQLVLMSRLEFEATQQSSRPGAREPVPDPLLTADALHADAPAPTASSGSNVQGLQERFTFDTFVPGPANEFAHAVARRVASWADGHFNPVLFHGPYGFGKTHLLNALAWEAMRQAPTKRVVYLTAERFLSTFVRAVMDRQTAAFKEELRGADLLIIDDVHFIAGKQSSQEELFHTLTALVEDGRRVVFSSDRAPAAMTEMDARLRSHLSAGLVCGLEPADRALRLGILNRKLQSLSRQHGFEPTLRQDVLNFLVDRFTDSVRELEGALNTLSARAGEGVSRLTLEEVQAILRPHLRAGEKRITIDDIQKATSEHYGMKQADLLSERRNRAIAIPRQVAMWLAKQLTTRSLPDIGRRFGGRDHTTVLHAVRRIEALRAEDPVLSQDLDTITRKLREAGEGGAFEGRLPIESTQVVGPSGEQKAAPSAQGLDERAFADLDNRIADIFLAVSAVMTCENPGLTLSTRSKDHALSAHRESFEAFSADHLAVGALAAASVLRDEDGLGAAGLHLEFAQGLLQERGARQEIGIVQLLLSETYLERGNRDLARWNAIAAAKVGVEFRRPEIAKRALDVLNRAERQELWGEMSWPTERGNAT